MDTDSFHTQLTNTVPCTRCGKVEVPAPRDIEDDPLCLPCMQALMIEAADAAYDKKNACRHGDSPDPECDGCYG